MELSQAVDRILSFRNPLKKVSKKFKDFQANLTEKFDFIKDIYVAGVDIIKAHYLKSIEAEMSKLSVLDYFLKNSDVEEIKYKIYDKKFNELVKHSLKPSPSDFLDQLLP